VSWRPYAGGRGRAQASPGRDAFFAGTPRIGAADAVSR
jgi:hypothetical protein